MTDYERVSEQTTSDLDFGKSSVFSQESVNLKAYKEMMAHYPDAYPDMQRYMDTLSPDDLIGRGVYKVVYPYQLGKVAAFFVNGCGPRMLKMEFYERKLLHCIVPELIPDIHLATMKPPVLVTDRVFGTFDYSKLPVSKDEVSNDQIRYTTHRLGQIGVTIDFCHEDNFTLDAEGYAVYVDSLYGDMWNKELVKDAIDNLPDERRDNAQHYLSRLSLVQAQRRI
jgi:hypothetical protein